MMAELSNTGGLLPPRLTEGPIDVEGLRQAVGNKAAGAVVVFVGTTRRMTGDLVTDWLEYEAHPPLALACLARLQEEACQTFSLVGCGIVHRLGLVAVGDASIAVAVASPHRADAFAAVGWLMDRVKATVPIWKREHTGSGESFWVHGEERPGP